MIEIHIKTDGEDIIDEFNESNPTLGEVSLVLYRLKQVEQQLIDKEFESKFEVSGG